MNSLASSQAFAGATSTAGILSIPTVDVIMYALVAALIIAAVIISNKHIKNSHKHLNTSEELLEKEREALAHRLATRTEDLIKAEEGRQIELQRNASFGELSRGLFHDLMNPLSAISIYMERLKESNDLSAEAKDAVTKMVGASQRLNSYMESVRRTLGKTDAAKQTSDFKKEASIVCDLVGYKARIGNVEIQIEAKDSVELPIHPVRLHQLLLNLVSNAIEACVARTDDAPRIVTVSAKKEGSQTIISISDTGIGVSKENLDKLFKVQFTTKKSGTGLGLLTIKTIVEKEMKGTITVTSEEGKGSVFMVRVP